MRNWLALAGAVVLVAACAGPVSVASPKAPSQPPANRSTEPTAPPTEPSADPTGTPAPSVGVGEPWVVYQWRDGQDDGIFLARPDGTGRHQLLPGMGGTERHPDWSPDGAHLAFVHVTPEDRSELWVVGVDGSGGRPLVSCDLPCNEYNNPDWSSDGSQIYVNVTRDATDGPPAVFGVMRVDVASGATTMVLERRDGLTAEQPRISPDGKLVAFTRGDIAEKVPGVAIFVADLKGGDERQLTKPALYGAHPDWTPDGRVLFNTYDLGMFPDTDKPSNLYVVAADGSHLRQVTDRPSGDRVTQPRLNPDGASVTYTRAYDGHRRIAVMGLDGSDDRLLSDPPLDGTHASLRPVP